jgi:hypothetical protein
MKSSQSKSELKPWFKRLGIINIVMFLANFAFAIAGLVMVIDLNNQEAWEVFLFFGIGATFLAYCMWQRLQPEPRERVSFDTVGITRVMSSGKLEKITWQELDTITILTTDTGPFAEDMFWVFECKSPRKGCFKALLSHIQTFEGFDNMQLIEAVGSTKLAYFLVWTKPAHTQNDSVPIQAT